MNLDFPSKLYIPGANALPMTVDYKLLQKNVEAKKLEKRIEIGKNLPQVALGAGCSITICLSRTTISGALMIGVNIPISGWWGGSHANKKKVSLHLKMPEMSLRILAKKLEISIRDKWNNVTAAHRKMRLPKKE
ncbi:hypothetical protein [Duncaniella dubosii]|uniref:hypothetical protein n=1 Tax=Duncaniella dubosii TaxID=2518971 RepID=UPI003F680764